MASANHLLDDFGRRLRDARLAAGFSQEELAHHTGLHRTYVGSVERGERNISLVNIVTLAAAVHIDPGALIEGMTPTADT